MRLNALQFAVVIQLTRPGVDVNLTFIQADKDLAATPDGNR
jgi:hypothetical protein